VEAALRMEYGLHPALEQLSTKRSSPTHPIKLANHNHSCGQPPQPIRNRHLCASLVELPDDSTGEVSRSASV
jgi:hypothetical protein